MLAVSIAWEWLLRAVLIYYALGIGLAALILIAASTRQRGDWDDSHDRMCRALRSAKKNPRSRCSGSGA